MSSAVSLSYVWDKSTYLKASRAAYEYELKASPKRFLGLLFIGLSQFGVVVAFKQETVGLLLISTILVIYWYALRWPMRKIILEKSFDRSNVKDHHFQVKVDKDGVHLDDRLLLWK